MNKKTMNPNNIENKQNWSRETENNHDKNLPKGFIDKGPKN